MSREKMREEFGIWFSAAVTQLVRCGAVERARELEAWRSTLELVWEESRAAVVVRLPNARDFSASDDAEFVLEQCRWAIETGGLKVSP